MFTQEDILKLLREGTDPTDLANQFAEVLNSAVRKKAEEEAAEQAARKEEEDAKLLFQHFKDFMNLYMPELWDYLFQNMDPIEYKDLKKILYDAMEQTKSAMKFFDNKAFFQDIVPDTKTNPMEEAPLPEEKKKTDEELIAEWLREMGIEITK